MNLVFPKSLGSSVLYILGLYGDKGKWKLVYYNGVYIALKSH